MIRSESNYVIVIFARHRKDPGKDIFFRGTVIRIESNYVIVIFARHRKDPGKDIFFRDTMIRSERNYVIVKFARSRKDPASVFYKERGVKGMICNLSATKRHNKDTRVIYSKISKRILKFDQ